MTRPQSTHVTILATPAVATYRSNPSPRSSHALSGKFPHPKEIYDRLEGRPTETVWSQVEASHKHFVVPPPRLLGETEGQYLARQDLERLRERFADQTGPDGGG